jgi:hypothetical protein
MKRINPSEAAAKILSADRITFLTRRWHLYAVWNT